MLRQRHDKLISFAGLPVNEGQSKSHEEGEAGTDTNLCCPESVGWHSTSANEEALIILHGSGVANIEGHPDASLKETCSPTSRPRHGTTSRTADRKTLSTSGWSRRQPGQQRSKCRGRL
jgi:hypothetical protein